MDLPYDDRQAVRRPQRVAEAHVAAGTNRGRLPEEAEPPVMFKFDANAQPIMGIGVEGDFDPVMASSSFKIGSQKGTAGRCGVNWEKSGKPRIMPA